MILPARRSFYLLGLLLITALVVSVIPAISFFWWGLLAMTVLAWLFDAGRAFTTTPVSIERHIPGSLPVGVKRDVTLHIKNNNLRALTLEVYDHHPHALHTEGLPLSLSIPADHHAELSYLVTAQQRGKHQFSHCQTRVLSPLGLWWRDQKHALASGVRAFPNF